MRWLRESCHLALAFVAVCFAVAALDHLRGWVPALIIMLSDVAVMSYATHVLGDGGMVYLLLRAAQWTFLAFVLALQHSCYHVPKT